VRITKHMRILHQSVAAIAAASVIVITQAPATRAQKNIAPSESAVSAPAAQPGNSLPSTPNQINETSTSLPPGLRSCRRTCRRGVCSCTLIE
jgi:hypothetical protein